MDCKRTEDTIKELETEPIFFTFPSLSEQSEPYWKIFLKYKIDWTQHVAKKPAPKIVKELQITGIKKAFVSIAEQRPMTHGTYNISHIA
jgi:hypothetical protein